MKTILLTGATGFLGSHLLRKLIDINYKIIVLKRSFSNTSRIKDLLNLENVISYNCDEIDLESIFEENKIDTIIHCATVYGRNNEQANDLLKANVDFPLQILINSIKHNVNTFINIDTILPKNINSYSLTKHIFAEWLDLYSEKIKVINLKLDHFYGAGDSSIKFIEWLISNFEKNEKVINLTEGSQTRDFIYIDDVIQAILTVLLNNEKIPIGRKNDLEVGSGTKTSIRTLVLTLKKLMNSKTKLNFGSLEYRKNEVLEYELNCTGLILLGWKPSITNIKEGLIKVLDERKK